MTDLQPENEAELVLAGQVPPGREDLADLASLMNEVRAFGSGPAPTPSAELAAILSGGTTDRAPAVVPAAVVPAASDDLAVARSRRVGGTRAVLSGVAASVAAALAAGTMGVLPVAAQERFDRVVDVVQRIVGGSDVPADMAPVVDLEPRPDSGPAKGVDDEDESVEQDRSGDRATDRDGTKAGEDGKGAKAGKQERERERDRDRREKSDDEDDSDPKSDRDPRGDRDRDDDGADDRDDDGAEQEDSDEAEDDNEAGVSSGSTKSAGDEDGKERRTAKVQSSEDADDDSDDES